jgi:plastocyanin
MQTSTATSPRSTVSRVALLTVIVVALAFALAACSSSSKSSSAATSGGISIKNLTFTSTPVTAGSKVTVTNNDTVMHTVTSDDGKSFDVSINPGSTATFTAPAAGTYKFHCKIHSQMHGSLTVT